MGVFGAMITAVSGIRAQSYALENISGNIANSQTTGFKRVDTSFVDLVPDMPAQRELAGSVLAFSRATNTIQGDMQTTGVPTHIAINGEGYFVVAERTGTAGDVPTFSAQDLYTRRGDFELDKSGYLRNGAGYYLKGVAIDPITGNTIGSSTGALRINNDQLGARQTTLVEYRANIPTYPETNNADRAVPTSELLQQATFTTNPATTGTVAANEQTAFLNQSLPAGSVTIYNNVGAPVNVQMRWTKISSPVYTAPPTATSAEDTWQLFYQSDANATGLATAWTRIGGNITFSSSGQLSSATTIISPITVSNVNVPAVTFNFQSGLTQFADANGQVTTSAIRQDGYTSGELQRISVTSDGRVAGTYSNGQVAPLAEIAVAQFQADNALKRRDGGVFEQTLESGQPILGTQGSKIIGGSLENSNTDIAEEFSKMIITQQAYTANTRVITTAQQMLQDTINIIR
ncbi:MAG: flagellar hook protein FlgE [Beijerinckiaceae bacterium]